MDWRCMTNPVGKKKKKRKIFLFLYTAHIFPWFYLSKPSKYLLHWGQFFYIQAGENIFHFSTETTLHFRIKLLIFNQMNTVLLYACFYWFWVRGGWEVRGVTRMDFEHSKNDTHPPLMQANVTHTLPTYELMLRLLEQNAPQPFPTLKALTGLNPTL